MWMRVKYVVEHPSGRADYRRVFAPELRPFIPGEPRQLKRSLGRASDPDLRRKRDAVDREYAAIAAKAERRRAGTFDVLDDPLIAYVAEAYRVARIGEDEDGRWNQEGRDLHREVAKQLAAAGVPNLSPWAGGDSARWAVKARETLEITVPVYRRLRAEGDLDGIEHLWRDDALDFVEARGLVVDHEAHDAIRKLCRALNDAAISAAAVVAQRLDGEDVPTPPEPEIAGKPPINKPVAPVVPLLETYEAYSAASGMTPGVREEWRRYIKALIAFVGHDDAARLTEDDVRSWRDMLLAESSDQGAVRKPVTVRDKYLRAVHAMLAWAVEERKLKTNVSASVKVKVPKTVKLRDRDFTSEEAARILRASLVPAESRLSPGYARARRWIPWLCAYTGARVNEMSQLRGQDVRQIDGIWTVRITPEAGNVKNKTARIVPLHPHLIEQGFPALAASIGNGPLFYDPTKVRVEKDGNRHYKKVGERLAAWVRETVGITDPNLQPNHGWRHTFKTTMRSLNVQERTADALQGHAPNTVGQTYWSVPLKTLAEAIALMPRYVVEGA